MEMLLMIASQVPTGAVNKNEGCNKVSVQISTLVDELSVLPEQGSATMRLLQLLDDPDSDARDILPVVEADPSMTARLLTLANSAFFGLKQHASNVWSAVIVVGFNVVRALATTGGLGLSDNKPGSMPPGYWEHSIATAASASCIAKLVGVRPSDAFSAALLHDIGSALLFRSASDRYNQTYVTAGEKRYTSLETEIEVFGAGHDEIGAEVLEQLFFPKSLVDAVRDHNLDPADVEDKLTKVIIAGISMAEYRGVSSTTEPPFELGHALKALGLDSEPSEDLEAQISQEIASLRLLLG